MGRNLAVGDIHGGYKGLIQALERANFDIEKDNLITMGDLGDGWSQTFEVIEYLKTVKNLTKLLGNHDEWLIKYLKYKEENLLLPNYRMWLLNGGYSSIDSYKGKEEYIDDHIDFLKTSKLYHILDNKLFVHAGYPLNFEIENLDSYPLIWDRTFWQYVCKGKIKSEDIKYEKVFIGHTPISYNKKKGFYYHEVPSKKLDKVINIDTGAAFRGVITVYDIDSGEYYQSDKLKDIYYNEKGRN